MFGYLAWPCALVYLIVGWFFPVICSIGLGVIALLLLLYILFVSKFIKFDGKKFDEDEIELLYNYPIYFRFYFFSINASAFLAGLQMSTIPMAIILIIKALYWFVLPLVFVYAVFSYLRPKLDPLFFRKELLNRQKDMFGKMQVESEINMMVLVYNKLWNINGDEIKTEQNDGADA